MLRRRARRPGERWIAAPAASSATSPSTTCTTPGSRTRNCRPTATPSSSSSTACRGTRGSSVPVPIDPRQDRAAHRPALVRWDATIWNRILQEYPYGVLDDTIAARAATVGTRRRCPSIRGDWFIATASPRAALLRRAATPREPRRAREASCASMPCSGHPAGTRDARRLQRLGHLALQPRPRTPRLGPGHVLADLRLRRAAREPRRPAQRQPVAGSRATSSPSRSARPGSPRTRSSTPAAKRSSHCPTACTPTYSPTPTTPGSTRARSPSSAIRSGPTAPSRPACRACPATSPAFCPRPIRCSDHLAKNPKAFTRQERGPDPGAVPGKEKVARS